MLNNYRAATPAVGACSACKLVFFYSGAGEACLGCGRPPDLILPLTPRTPIATTPNLAPPAPVPERVEPIYFAVKCPHCDNDVHLHITEREISVVSPSLPPPAEEVVVEPPLPSATAPPPGPTLPPWAMTETVGKEQSAGVAEPAPLGSATEVPGPGSQGPGSVGERPAPATMEQVP